MKSVDVVMDRWAEWLGRVRSSLAGRPHPHGERLRREARVQEGQRVLEVGAGIGLLTFETARHLGPNGLMVALDRSRAALRECQRRAADGGTRAPVVVVQGDAARLPFAAGQFDIVLVASVLLYVTDQTGAIGELHRVLRPGGRVALWEPVLRVAPEWPWRWEGEWGDLGPAHARVVAYQRERSGHAEAIGGFDERDLVRACRAVGFVQVALDYEYRYRRDLRATRDMVDGWLTDQASPVPPYAEAARAVLGDAAVGHLARFTERLLAQPLAMASAGAWITAEKAGGEGGRG
jgi:SAM-dependent methyltransferase